jgi:tRNA-specific 2-thiouridylase
MSFPLGDLTKPQVRRIAAEAGLPVASKRDSMDLCFLAGTDRGRFLARHGGVTGGAGEIVDVNGAVLGRHRGQHLFTVGQRRGLGVDHGGPLYVLDKQAAANRVVVGPRRALRTTRVPIADLELRRPAERVDGVKLRYRSAPLAARISGPDAVEIELSEAVEGAAPGQLACLLDGDLVVGWATIARRAAVV